MAGNTAKFLESKLTYLKDEQGRERVVDEDGSELVVSLSTERTGGGIDH